MSLETVSTKRNRVYSRKFDHDEAIRLRAEGWTWQSLADHFGVVPQAVRRVVNPTVRKRMDKNTKERFKALCGDCGRECTHNWWTKRARHDRVVCFHCSQIRTREENLLTRLDPDGNIRCSKCGEHRTHDMYRFDRGFPVSHCRTCETASRRANREANVERERAYMREYHRKRKAAA